MEEIKADVQSIRINRQHDGSPPSYRKQIFAAPNLAREYGWPKALDFSCLSIEPKKNMVRINAPTIEADTVRWLADKARVV